MSKLTKVQKKLKEMGIKHEVKTNPEDYQAVETTDIVFWDAEGARYSIDEHTGSSGAKTVQGIMVYSSKRDKGFQGDYWNQTNIVEWLENNKDRFEEEQKTEDGLIELWLTTYKHRVGIHSVKLSVVNSANNRFVADFDIVEDAVIYANNHGIEVKTIKSK